MSFTCTTCVVEHDVDSISFGSYPPDQGGLSEEERDRSELGERIRVSSQPDLRTPEQSPDSGAC